MQTCLHLGTDWIVITVPVSKGLPLILVVGESRVRTQFLQVLSFLSMFVGPNLISREASSKVKSTRELGLHSFAHLFLRSSHQRQEGFVCEAGMLWPGLSCLLSSKTFQHNWNKLQS